MSASTDKDLAKAEKKPYSPPRVTVLGDLRTLTQSGSLTPTESMTMMMRKP
ncbi:lasso RiPP family leader peptide-containing protein [Caenimonas koreensis]|uniref:Lasso RiPP family leader peptide-containing protein n=1 Tax=Caenimonas koreensis DSM 17982 TaxID=1121255 RepID=A0A844AWT3_9BURK|nr:lasso RiPP family leader peptide-containing protein [Caenimonas koreensis]MRD46818.1 lasso RiPP family leader peptide-containing protein [Caenimonas koreensis DSM 17982]